MYHMMLVLYLVRPSITAVQYCLTNYAATAATTAVKRVLRRYTLSSLRQLYDDAPVDVDVDEAPGGPVYPAAGSQQ